MNNYNFGNNLYYVIVNKSEINVSKSSNRLETNQARVVLERMLNLFDISLDEILINDNGKPYFKNSNIFFNYSHSKNYIACAVSLSEVGIDIEDIDSYISNRVARKYLDCKDDTSKRIEEWVKKESYGKLKGLGFQISFKDIYLNDIKEKNYYIKEKYFICSIYCDNEEASFNKIELIG